MYTSTHDFRAPPFDNLISYKLYIFMWFLVYATFIVQITQCNKDIDLWKKSNCILTKRAPNDNDQKEWFVRKSYMGKWENLYIFIVICKAWSDIYIQKIKPITHKHESCIEKFLASDKIILDMNFWWQSKTDKNGGIESYCKNIVLRVGVSVSIVINKRIFYHYSAFSFLFESTAADTIHHE